MKYSKRSVFFQRIRLDAHLRHVGAHLSVATLNSRAEVRLRSDQRLALPDVWCIG
jgi:hypothetical protein